MKTLLGFAPFYPPSAPPLGIAYLKAAVNHKLDNITIKLVDWNIQFFSRWLQGKESSFCEYCPNNGIACICPDILLKGNEGQKLIEGLRLIPRTRAEQESYIDAAIKFQGLYNSLRYCYNALLKPYIESKGELPDPLLHRLFHEELSLVNAEKPDLVAFSVLAEQGLLYSLALAKIFKRELGLPTIMGGAMLSHLDPKEILAAFDWVDYIFTGEAEETLPLFLSRWPEKTKAKAGGFCWRAGEDIDRYPFQSTPSLEELPFPDFSDFTLGKYLLGHPVIPILSSRGCYWGRCAFCSHTRPYASGIRHRAIEKVVDEMENHKNQFGAKHFLLVDEVISPNRLQALSKELLRRNTDIIFGAEGIRPERGLTLSILKTAYKAGLRWIYVGVESVTQRLLDLIDKGTKVKNIHQIIRHCDQVGITAHLSYIIGLPSQTHQELARDISFLQKRPVDFSPFVLLLGSAFQRDPEHYGITIEDQEVLFCSDKGSLHAPRFYFTMGSGLSPTRAARIVRESGSLPKVRPHLGEIHAVLLSEIGFFNLTDRPRDVNTPEKYAEKILLHDRDHPEYGTPCYPGPNSDTIPSKFSNSAWDVLHLAGCYESQWRTEDALNILLEAWNRGQYDDIRGQLLLHIAACLNQLGQYHQVIEVIRHAGFSFEKMTLHEVSGSEFTTSFRFDCNSEKVPFRSHVSVALWGELVRAYFSLQEYEKATASAEKMLDLGSGGSGIYFALGLSYEALGRYTDAINILNKAQELDLTEPEINLALSRCYQALGDQEGYIREFNKAQRKMQWS